jgi:cell division septum initiation protein DivIVA
MTHPYKALATLVLTLSVTAGYAQSAASSADNPPQTHPHHHTRHVEKPGPSVEDQIQALQNQMQQQASQIQTLQQQLSERDAQLQQAQQAAQQAQAAAQQAQQAANDEQQTLSANTTAVSNLQTSVADLKSSTSAAVVEVKQQAEEVKKAVEHPDALYYRGITLSPAGSFIEAATVWRSAATGGGINTPFTGIPLEYSGAAQQTEFKGSGRQSRLSLKANGKLDNVDLTAYYEMDWLGTGITSNNNQSNSYVLRMRQLWARAAFNSGWNVSGGQMWSLATETTHGLDNGTEILPGTIDPQYEAGFVWTRQYGFRVTKDFGNKFWLGVSAENAQALPGGSNPSDEALGEAGVGGGLYNSTSNYSFNRAPDLIAKMAFEPGWGHWELFGISRFFYNRIYPNATATPASSVGAYNNTVTAGGGGGGFRVPMADKKISLGLKGLYGDGVGRYGSSTIADITFRKDGTISPLHTWSALSTVELFPTPRWYIYLNYGGDYVGRDLQDGGTDGYGLYSANMSGCDTEGLPGGDYTPGGTGTCSGNTKDVQELTAGYWYNFYKGPKGMFRYGLQYSWFDRNLWSGAGGPLNPDGGAFGKDNEVETSMRYYLP